MVLTDVWQITTCSLMYRLHTDDYASLQIDAILRVCKLYQSRTLRFEFVQGYRRGMESV